MPSVSYRSKTMNSIQKSHYASLTTYFSMITERSIKLLSSVMLISANRIKVWRLWLTCFEDGPIRILTFARWMLKTRKTMASWQAFPSFPPRAPLAFLSHLKLPFSSLSNACHAGYNRSDGCEGRGCARRLVRILHRSTSSLPRAPLLTRLV